VYRCTHQSPHFAITTTTTNTEINIAKEIQIGDKTHHHDHEIIPTSFNAIKRIARSVIKLGAGRVVELLNIVCCFLNIVCCFPYCSGYSSVYKSSVLNNSNCSRYSVPACNFFSLLTAPSPVSCSTSITESTI